MGGAGYIGAHVVRLLAQRGEKVVVIDDLSYGTADRIGDAKLVQLDVAAAGARKKIFQTLIDEDVTAVIHFAARKQVGESVEKPMWYYQQNVGGLANVMAAMRDAGTRQMIFSSSAAVYGQPDVPVVSEDLAGKPINAWGLRWIGLRYFNVAGSGWDELGDPARLNLIPMVLERLAKGQSPKIFGTDYDTPDGTCIRDYIHVRDLADAHLHALDYVASGKEMEHHVFNVGTGQGTSVREIIDGIREVTGIEFTADEDPRRPGDPAQLIGDTTRIRVDLDWKAENGIKEILESAWSAWQAGPDRIPGV